MNVLGEGEMGTGGRIPKRAVMPGPRLRSWELDWRTFSKGTAITDGGRRYLQCNEIKAELEAKTLFKILLMIVDMSSEWEQY